MMVSLRKGIASVVFSTLVAQQALAQGFNPFDPIIGTEPLPLSQPKIQVAIALDTSGSMSGLIDQTKRQIWKLVNSLSGYERNGQKPILQIALLQYGSASLPLTLGAMQTLKPLSTQLDQVSKELFSLTANGSEEYVPMAITKAVLEYEWSANPQDVRAIFIAGNETIHQGPIKADALSPLSSLAAIEVNTIYAGNTADAVFEEWQHLASTLGGSSGNIDQSLQIPNIPTPFDDELAQLNKQVNDTIIPFGSVGHASWVSYLETDKLYSGSGGSFYDLVNAKSSGFYDISSWDLVTAVMEKDLQLASVDLSLLVKELSGLSLDELKAVIEAKFQERKEIEAKIADIAQQREEYLAPLIEAAIGKTEALVQETLVKALVSQLEKKGFVRAAR
jgi:hypothetical protein